MDDTTAGNPLKERLLKWRVRRGWAGGGASQAVVGPLERELVRMRGKIETVGNGWDGTRAMIS